jgi:hypothetical protein
MEPFSKCLFLNKMKNGYLLVNKYELIIIDKCQKFQMSNSIAKHRHNIIINLT